MAKISYQDPLHLAVMVQGRLSVDRPGALVAVTSNPGESDKHYIAIVQRVYSAKSNLQTFVGYITYRFCEVRFWRKNAFLPRLSSMELRDCNFNEYNPPIKIHFHRDKVAKEDPQLYLEAGAAAAASGLSGEEADKLFEEEIGERAFEKAYAKILDLIDYKI